MCGVLLVLCCVASGAGACTGLKEAGFEPMLLIAYAFLQAAVVATLLKFSTRAVADGALLHSAWLEVLLLQHHCRIKDWRYSQAAVGMPSVCDFFDLRVDSVACGVCYVGSKGCGGVSNACWVEGGALFELPLMFSDAVMQVMMVRIATLLTFSMREMAYGALQL